MIIILYS